MHASSRKCNFLKKSYIGIMTAQVEEYCGIYLGITKSFFNKNLNNSF